MPRLRVIARRDCVPKELALPVRYKELVLDCGYRIDLLVAGEPILEIKSVETLLPIHEAQTLTYMKLARISIGVLMNFNVTKLQNGIRRFVL
jgi:GxxExxY protein